MRNGRGMERQVRVLERGDRRKWMRKKGKYRMRSEGMAEGKGQERGGEARRVLGRDRRRKWMRKKGNIE